MAPAKGKKKRAWKPNFSYKVDYNDHFETPLIAYQDICPIVDAIGPKNRSDNVLYDPYYCDGRTAEYLQALGFDKVVHAKRDFYKDIVDNNVPVHHAFITNPPYSDQHKEKCLHFCLTQFQEKQRPFFLLMPNYVAARSYYRRLLGSSVDDVAYLIPSKPYEYDHPEGTGHETSPFGSLWYCGVGRNMISQVKRAWERYCDSCPSPNLPTFAGSLAELEAMGAIPTEKRPNPRQRKKRRALLSQMGEAFSGTGGKKSTQTHAVKVAKSKKTSLYRDGKGKRLRKRF